MSDPLGRAKAELLLWRPAPYPNHDLERRGAAWVLNESRPGRVVAVGEDGAVERSVPTPGSPPFTRGLLALGDGHYVVGDQEPFALHVVDLERERLVETIALPGAPRESVFAICALPDGFGPPPAEIAWTT